MDKHHTTRTTDFFKTCQSLKFGENKLVPKKEKTTTNLSKTLNIHKATQKIEQAS
jgi:hypothetical protein